jgi:hypothetical protein
MSLEVIIGEEATFDARFYNAAGGPVDPSGPPTYRILDQDGEYLIGGSATQDIGAPERWYAQIMIPEGAPATDAPDEFYVINWRLVSLNGEISNFSERFKAYSGLEEENPPVEAVFGIQGTDTVTDVIVTNQMPCSYSYKMIDPYGMYPLRNTDPVIFHSPEATKHTRSNYYFQHDIDVSNVAFTPAGIEEVQFHWNIKYDDGSSEHEIHPCYLASNYVMKLVFDVRQKIDKGQQFHLNRSLNISDWEIIYSLGQAINKMNSFNPTTSWGITNLPVQLTYFLIEYTCVELLRQLYLAYGLSSFDFQGQSTQLSMDLTTYIQTMMDTMEQSVNERFLVTKKMVARSQRPIGVLSVNLGPSTNFIVFNDPGSNIRFRLRGYLFRGLY